MDPAPELHVVVPVGIDDPARPSGGNRYDRRVIDALTGLGRVVHEHAADDLEGVLDRLPDGGVVLLDGLVGVAEPEVVTAAAERLRIVVLLHMPFAEAFPERRAAERAVLAAAVCVVTPSEWSRTWVVEHHGIDPERVRVAVPGVDPGSRNGRRASTYSSDGSRLLCLAAVTSDKGHDVLLGALAELADLDWSCTCAGSLDLEPDYVAGLHELALRSGIGDRVRFVGPLAGDQVDAALDEADLLVSASRHEAYGMSVTEALARGVPAVVSDVGGHAEALGDGGVLVPPDDPDRLAATLRRWLESADERDRLRAAAAQRRVGLVTWETTAGRVAEAVDAAVNRTGSWSVSPDTTAAGR